MDCSDGSDESHCRCDMPLDYFDCSAWQWWPPSSLQQGFMSSIHQQGFYHDEAEKEVCILRAMLCDGRAHCAHGVDENAEVKDDSMGMEPFPQTFLKRTY